MPPLSSPNAQAVRAANDAASLRPLFMLDPALTFLNHASFGACPVPVFEAYQRWQVELERNPFDFIKHRAFGLVNNARDVVAEYAHCPPEDCVFVVNATAGVYTAIQSLAGILELGDEILMTDQEYVPCSYAWADFCQRTGVKLVGAPISLPYTTDEAFVESFWSYVTPRTRVIYLSHVTSITAIILPVKAICERARAAGIITMIDGAHGTGQIPVDILDINPDFYGGNCHKWMCAPKGTGFLYVAKPYQAPIRPLFLSWGWRDDADFTTKMHEQGTRDPAAILAVPDAIAFMRDHDWDSVRTRSHALLIETRAALHDLTGLPILAPESSVAQMAAIPLPDRLQAESVKESLFEHYHIEVPVHPFKGRALLRVSIQGYNDESDTDALIRALGEVLASPD